MLQLRDIQARLPRLRKRMEEMTQERLLWQGSESVLLPLEQRQYLIDLQQILMRLERGLLVLEDAARRIEPRAFSVPLSLSPRGARKVTSKLGYSLGRAMFLLEAIRP